ncbi:MAG: c-type cytochrome [Acidobacteriaceae bacterium]|nr:c-type cytochrome [Acidobacteriaceae bacterium]
MRLRILKAAVAVSLAAAPFTLLAQSVQELFESRCGICHGLDGKGGEHAPDIVASSKFRNAPVSSLTRIVHDGIPASGMPAFGSVLNSDQIGAIASYLRSLRQGRESARTPGDAGLGRALFRAKAHCAECHGFDGQGGLLASDLSGYGKTHSSHDLRQQILSHDEDERRAMTRIVTRQGRAYEGLTRNEDNFSLQLETLDGGFVFIGKPDLAVLHHQKLSSLLAGNGVRLTERDLDNLIAYLSQTPLQP